MSVNPPPPPPPAYSAATSTNAVHWQPGYRTLQMFHEVPVRCTCPACGAAVITSTTYEIGVLTWIVCLVVAFMGLWLGCCLIPFCINSCKDVVHQCPNCGNVVGKYNRM